MAEARSTGARTGDQRIEIAMGHLLRGGVVLAALIVVAGGIQALRQGRPPLDYRIFHGAAATLTTPAEVWRGVRAGDGRGLIQMGLLLLIATPVARVLLGLIGFLAERDWLYAAVSLLVLGILVYSLVRGG